MSETSSRDWPRRLLIGFYWFLAAEFVLGAMTKFAPGETVFGPAYSVKFADWGYPSWFRFVIGGVELICAILLVVPRRRARFLGAGALVVVLVGAVVTHVANQDPIYESVSAPLHLAIMAAIAWASRPAHWRELRPVRRVPLSDQG
ncbi:DoxX family protein [Nonomuraea sp. LPB2021202275-12-8]|uniref:DoxX family protein n=1 Tax=Nonomuraea sp. LPB2021202275-12-8 TaxID=3120159 RepID=UPI00300C99E9